MKLRRVGFSHKRYHYVLTNKRALVLEGKKAENLHDSRDLLGASVAVTQKFDVDKGMVYDPEHRWKWRTPGQEFVTIGNLTFIAEGHPPMSFEQVEDPDSVAQMAEKFGKSSPLP